MAGKQELALYYVPKAGPKVRKCRAVLARLGIRIRNVGPEQAGEPVGKLAGVTNYSSPAPTQDDAKQDAALKRQSGETAGEPANPEGCSPAPAQADATQGAALKGQAGETVGGRTISEDESPAPQIPEEMLVLCYFDNAKLDRLLRELRKTNASVELKAILTETNAGWSFYQLYRELRKERDFHFSSNSGNKMV